MEIVIYLIVVAGLGLIPASIAKNKGKEFVVWYVYGFFLFPVALIHSLVVSQEQPPGQIAARPAEERVELTSELVTSFDLNCPVDILGYDISLEGQEYYLSGTFRNNLKDTVTALRLEMTGYNSFDEVVLSEEGKEEMEILLQDLSGKSYTAFHTPVKVKLPHPEIRKVKMRIKQIRLASGETINIEESNLVSVNPIPLKGDLKFIKGKFPSAVCKPEKLEDFWLCSCGHPNLYEVTCCVQCAQDMDRVFQLEEMVSQNEEDKKKAVMEAAAAQVRALEAEKQKKAENKKKLKRFVGAAAAVIVAAVVFSQVIQPAMRYNSAVKLLEQQQYDEAIAVLDKILDYRDSRGLRRQVNYEKAVALYESGELLEAKDLFSSLRNYQDSKEYKVKALAGLVDKAIEEDQHTAAIKYLALIPAEDERRVAGCIKCLEHQWPNIDQADMLRITKLVPEDYEGRAALVDPVFYSAAQAEKSLIEKLDYLKLISADYQDTAELLEHYGSYEWFLGYYQLNYRNHHRVSDVYFMNDKVYLAMDGKIYELHGNYIENKTRSSTYTWTFYDGYLVYTSVSDYGSSYKFTYEKKW